MTVGRSVDYSRLPEMILAKRGKRFFGVFDTTVEPKYEPREGRSESYRRGNHNRYVIGSIPKFLSTARSLDQPRLRNALAVPVN
jgi:hypothetical protein